MNVFFRELKSHRKGLLLWSLGMFFLVASGVAKFYGYSTSGTSSVSDIYKIFPHSLQVLFGLNGFDLSTPGGVYGILFMYVVVTAAIHAILLGTDLVSKEERDQTAEFVFTKPISRASVITQKLSAGLINLVILNVVTLISSIYFVSYFAKSDKGTSDMLLMDAGLFVTQLIFFSVGAAIAAASKKPKTAPGKATAILLASFILYFGINISGKIDYLSFLTPFKYFEARVMLHDGYLDPAYFALAVFLIIFSVFITYIAFRKRDITT